MSAISLLSVLLVYHIERGKAAEIDEKTNIFQCTVIMFHLNFSSYYKVINPVSPINFILLTNAGKVGDVTCFPVYTVNA